MKSKKGLKKFNISNRLAYTLMVILSIALLGIGVFAWGGSAPSTMGHSAGELDLSAGINGNTLFNGPVRLNSTGVTKLTVQSVRPNIAANYFGPYIEINNLDDDQWKGLLFSSEGTGYCTEVLHTCSNTLYLYDVDSGMTDACNRYISGDTEIFSDLDTICTYACQLDGGEAPLCPGSDCQSNDWSAYITHGSWGNSCYSNGIGYSDTIDCICASSQQYATTSIIPNDPDYSLGVADGELVFASSVVGSAESSIPTSTSDTDILLSVSQAGDLKADRNIPSNCEWVNIGTGGTSSRQYVCPSGKFLTGVATRTYTVIGLDLTEVEQVYCCEL